MCQPTEQTHRRLSVLELAQTLGNVSEACRRQGISRTQFYEYKQRFQQFGLEGLKDYPPPHIPHPKKTTQEVIQKILELSLKHPGWGCIRLSEALKTQGINISSPTVQNILIKHNMGNKYERILKLEEKAVQQFADLTEEQIALISKANPCFLERTQQSKRPGELLAQDAIYIHRLPGIGKIYLEVIVDTFSNYAFGFIHPKKIPDCAVALLHNDVIPFFKEHNLTVNKIVTNNSRQYCGKPNHHFELYLLLNDIEHQCTTVQKPEDNCFVKRFDRISLAEFFRKALSQKLYSSIEELQNDFTEWLFFYNHKRPHCGYPNMGRRPYDLISEYIKISNIN